MMKKTSKKKDKVDFWINLSIDGRDYDFDLSSLREARIEFEKNKSDAFLKRNYEDELKRVANEIIDTSTSSALFDYVNLVKQSLVYMDRYSHDVDGLGEEESGMREFLVTALTSTVATELRP